MSDASRRGARGDALGERLVATGLAPNMFLLDNDHSLCVPDDFDLPTPWSLPSRMFRFPIEVHAPYDGRPRQIGLRHPLLADHPFVLHVEQILGMTLSRDPVYNDCGYTSADLAQWWHAVDLVLNGLWRELLETMRFTTREHIARAVAFGMSITGRKGQCIDVRAAREVMARLGSKEPEDRMSVIRTQLMAPSPCRSDRGGESWPINTVHQNNEASAWAFIFGMEDGWFQRTGPYLRWSPVGRSRYAGKPDADWMAVTRTALESLGGEATADDVCRMIEGLAEASDGTWRAKVREALPRIAFRGCRAQWTIKHSMAAA